MALPAIMRRLFAGGGYGPLLKDDIVSKYISIQDWSSSFDYQPATVVRGSDGLLYWSVAQSGPNVGGAHNPTADTGAYWSTLPMRTPSLADDSNTVATTKWVKDLAIASVYVNPAGSDSNDGMTSAKAVATVQRAVDIASSLPTGVKAQIRFAAGTYIGNVQSYGASIVFELQGNVTISGNADFAEGSSIKITGAYSLAAGLFTLSTGSCVNIGCSSFSASMIGVSGGSALNSFCPVTLTRTSAQCFYVQRNSFAFFNAAVSMTCSGAAYAAYVHDRGVVIFGDTLTLSATSINTTIFHIDTGSAVHFLGLVSVSGTGNTSGFYVLAGSCAYIVSGFSFGDCLSSGSSLNISGSYCALAGNCEIYSSVTETPVNVYLNGSLLYTGSDTLTIHLKGAGQTALACDFSGCFRMTDGGLSIVGRTGITHRAAVSLSRGSVAFIQDFSVSGAFTGTVLANGNSVFNIPASATVNNNATGARYGVYTGSIVDVAGAGVNRLPGNAAGVVNSSQYAYYG